LVNKLKITITGLQTISTIPISDPIGDITTIETGTLTPSTNITLGYTSVKIRNGVVYLIAYINKTDSTEFTADRTDLFTMSSNMIPTYTQEFTVSAESSIGGYFNTSMNVVVNSTGTVQADKITNLTNAKQIRMSISYLI